MKTTRSGTYYLLLLLFILSMVGCTVKEKEPKDSPKIEFKNIDKSATPLEVVRFFSSRMAYSTPALNTDHIQI